jgi:hypothetical protein
LRNRRGDRHRCRRPFEGWRRFFLAGGEENQTA